MQHSIINEMRPSETVNDYQRNLNLSIQWIRWLLKPIGLWPNSRVVRLYLLVNIACYSLLTFLFIPSILYVFLELEDLYNKLKQFGPLIFCVMAFAKYSSLIVHQADIRECLRRIEWDWKNITYGSDRDIMLVNANFGRKLTILCTSFMLGGYTFYFIALPISIGRISDEENLTFIPLVFPFSSYISDTRYSPTNEIVFSLQLTAGALMHGITSATCSLAATLAAHACGQMQVLMNRLNHLIYGRSDMNNSIDGRIASIVDQHVHILKFLALIERTLQQVSFVELLGCTLDICLVGYYVIMESKSNDVTSVVTYIIYLVSLTFNIFIFCYIGEMVAEHCRRIGDVSYMIEWYRLPGKNKRSCIMIIAMSSSSMKLTAGNIVSLSINTFTNVVKTSVTFLNVLRATT